MAFQLVAEMPTRRRVTHRTVTVIGVCGVGLWVMSCVRWRAWEVRGRSSRLRRDASRTRSRVVADDDA